MKFYEASASIGADPETIWSIITDAPGYARWENGVVRVEGTIAPGETIKVVSEANPDRTFPVKVSGWKPSSAHGVVRRHAARPVPRRANLHAHPGRGRHGRTSRSARSTPGRCSA